MYIPNKAMVRILKCYTLRTYLVFLGLQCFNPAPSSFHCLQEFGILFLSLLQGGFLSLNCTLSLFKLLGERRKGVR